MNQVETQRDTPYDGLCNTGRLNPKGVLLLSCRFVKVWGFYKLRCMKGYEINATFQSVKGLRRADRYILWL